MMHDGLTDTQRAWLASREHAEAFGDLSAVEINKLSFDEWAARTGQPTMSEIAAHAHGYASDPGTPTPAPQQPAEVQQAVTPEFQGPDPASDEYFHAWRANRTRGGEGRGIFDSVDSRSDVYASAVRAQAGRTAMSNANVVEPPRLTDRYVRQDDMRDTRTAARRFGTPGNSNQF